MDKTFGSARKRAFLEFFRNDRFPYANRMELTDIGYGTARARMEIGPDHHNANGRVMGGALFTLADLALGAASNSYGALAVGYHMSIHFVAPAVEGVLTATAREVFRGGRTGLYDIEVRDARERLCARMSGTVSIREDREIFPGAVEK